MRTFKIRKHVKTLKADMKLCDDAIQQNVRALMELNSVLDNIVQALTKRGSNTDG